MQLLNPHGTATREDLVKLVDILLDKPDITAKYELLLYLNRDQRISGSLNEVQGTNPQISPEG